MPTTRRSRAVPAAPEELWRTVADPHHLPRWWPKVERVESVGHDRFTQVLRTEKGRPVRADFRVTTSEKPRRRTWVQDVAGTPFERILRSAQTTIILEPRDDGTTKVTLSAEQSLRGMAVFGGWMVRRATRKLLDEALDSLAALHG